MKTSIYLLLSIYHIFKLLQCVGENELQYDRVEKRFRTHSTCVQHREVFEPVSLVQNFSSGGPTSSKLQHRSRKSVMSLTLVSMYLDLGEVDKSGGVVYTRGSYERWLLRLSRVLNPLVFYTEVPSMLRLLVRERAGRGASTSASENNRRSADFIIGRSPVDSINSPQSEFDRPDLSNRTRAFLIDRFSLRSFREYLPRIRKVLRDPPFPRYFPNTVVPEYGATMHAKYDALERAIRANYFGSKYFAWIDVGVFRELSLAGAATGEGERGGARRSGGSRPTPHFGLLLPAHFDEQRVAFGQVYAPNFELTPEQIVAKNEVWLCGCFFAAERGVMLRFAAQYAAGVEEMLVRGLSSTDQQVLYATLSPVGRSWHRAPTVEVQAFIRDASHSSLNEWFFLAYLCKEHWERSHVS